METVFESWSLLVILLAAFVVGWAAEIAQTFMSRALALSILAWLQTLPEFAVEATIAWHQQKDLMIANLTGSLRLIVGLGLPMIFFVHFFFQGFKRGKFIREIQLHSEDSFSILAVFISVLYFVWVWAKGSLSVYDSLVLILIYAGYLGVLRFLPVHDVEETEDLPWIGKKIVLLPKALKIGSVLLMFGLGGAALYLSVHPFIQTLEKWSLSFGISTFVFVQWVAPFLSEFPEKVSAFNWARQKNKAPMAIMNMVGSNINQWTMLAAMIPIVFSLSLRRVEPIVFNPTHRAELLLTIAQSMLAGVLLLDLKFSIWDAGLILILWLVQFFYAPARESITWVYFSWVVWECGKMAFLAVTRREIPSALRALPRLLGKAA